MDFDYYVHVRAVNDVAGERQELDFITPANFHGDRENYVLVYDEISPEDVSRTSITVTESSKVSLRREGQLLTVMSIEGDKRNLAEIITPFGAMSMAVVGRRVESRCDIERGTLKFAYTTYTGGEHIGDMSFHLDFYRKGTQPDTSLI